MDCGSSCVSEGYEQECINERCVDGCFCPDGMVLSSDYTKLSQPVPRNLTDL